MDRPTVGRFLEGSQKVPSRFLEVRGVWIVHLVTLVHDVRELAGNPMVDVHGDEVRRQVEVAREHVELVATYKHTCNHAWCTGSAVHL